MDQYKPDAIAKETEAAFARLDKWLGVVGTEADRGNAIPPSDPTADVWGRPLPVPFDVPDDPIDFDSMDAMFTSLGTNLDPDQSSAPSSTESKRRYQSKQERS